MSKKSTTEAQPQAAQPQPPQLRVEAPVTLAGALLVAQASIDSVGKDARNTFHKYSYTSAEGMIAACRMALHGAGLAFSRVGWELSPDGMTVTSEFLLQHPASDNTMAFTCPWLVVVEKGRPIDKAMAGALTTSMGYFLRDLLLLPREDEDGSMDRRNDDAKGPPPDVGFRRQAAPAPAPARAGLAELNRKLVAPAATPAPAAAPVQVRANNERSEQGTLHDVAERTVNGQVFTVCKLNERLLVIPAWLVEQVRPFDGSTVRVVFGDRGDQAGIIRSVELADEVATRKGDGNVDESWF